LSQNTDGDIEKADSTVSDYRIADASIALMKSLFSLITRSLRTLTIFIPCAISILVAGLRLVATVSIAWHKAEAMA
jgi:hypothetical protein